MSEKIVITGNCIVQPCEFERCTAHDLPICEVVVAQEDCLYEVGQILHRWPRSDVCKKET